MTQPAEPPHQNPRLVVGIGASAGGIQALQAFFTHAAASTGIAYVVILHLSPDHESHLADVLQATTSLRVVTVVERVRLEGDRVYVIAPNSSLEVRDGHLVASPLTRREQRRAPVDLFFRALADAWGSRSAAVVLSGTGPDGTAGLKRVKEHGGLAIAQDPHQAAHADMPRAAIATGLVDFVLPVADMPRTIADYLERIPSEDGSDGGGESAPAAADHDALRDVLMLVRARTGHDFSNYKVGTLQRRLHRRMSVRGLPTVASYTRAIREQPDEAVALMKELLISVTSFFRDPPAFDLLATSVVPRLFEHKHARDQVRVWVPGCATGEEAYSIAMLLAERGSATPDAPAIQVFATDLDQQAIAAGREGFYTDPEVLEVSEERLRRFFRREAKGYRVRRELRELVLFAPHNVIKDPPFSHLDLISCRNLLIYLNRTVQGRVMETFHFALRPGAYLFLGGSESPDGTADLFLTINQTAHIYQNRTATVRLIAPAATLPNALPVPKLAGGGFSSRIAAPDLHQRLLEQYAPPSVVVTDEHKVIHVSESAGRYFQVPAGEPTREVVALVRDALRSDLRIALHEAARQQSGVSARVPAVNIDGERRDVTLTVRPVLAEGDPFRGFMLILFEEDDAEIQSVSALALPASTEAVTARLEEELERVKAQLRATIEEYETHVEEAKASNEELQAMNEELRSAAEELETSKEELQSVNEELTTVNQELKIKVEELALKNNDFQNLINSSDLGTIFLDRQLRVKLSTPAARTIFNLLPTDMGRPLSDITSHLLYDGLYHDARQVLRDLKTVDREIEARDGQWYLLHLRPYRTTEDRIDGVVITFQDVSERREAERQGRRSEERLRLLIDSAIDYAIFTMLPDGTIDTWNAGAQRMFGFSAEEIVGRPFDLLFTPEDREARVPTNELERAARDGRADDERFHIRKNGERFYCSGVTTRLDPTGGLGFAKIARDRTEERHAAHALREAKEGMEARIAERTRELQTEILQRTSAQEQSTMLLRKLVTSQEEERARIARDLHDQLGQQLTALRLTLERLTGEGHPADQLRAQLERAVSLARSIDAEVGFLAWELRPAVLDDLGLAAALPRFVEQWSEHYGIEAEYRSSGFEAGQLAPEGEVAFYRIAQEALNNVAKHAAAARVDVMLGCRDRTVVLVIEDDGIGFEPNKASVRERGIGLVGMSERAALIDATLQIESTPGKGTSVFVRRAVQPRPPGNAAP